jgi:cell division protease FtsH
MKMPSPKRLLIIGTLLVAPLAVITLFGLDRVEEARNPSWPYNIVDTASEVSLSEVVTLLRTETPDRRAAVLAEYIYVETQAGAGEPMDKDAVDETAAENTETEAPADASAATTVEDTEQPPGVVKAQLPFPSSGFISEYLENPNVDLQIFRSDRYAPSTVDRIIQILPVLIILLLVFFVFGRSALKSLGLTSSFEIVEPNDLKEGLDDVAGVNTARDDIREIIELLKNPEAISALGGRMPKGALFDGPAGTGKTLLARAMAKEAGVPFIKIDASSMTQIFVGAGAMKVRQAFREARKRAPCIIFIDEIDAMGRARGSAGGAGGDEKETTLNALLTELDGFEAREGIFLVAATNRPEILDKALIRPGRIDRRVTMTLPDIEGRKEIIEVHCRKVKIAGGLDLHKIAATTYGMSGAELANLVNEAALAAARRGHNCVEMEDFREARDRLLMPRAGSQMRLDDDDRHLTAVHEAGHALIAVLCKNADPIEKATILPQGGAAGYVLQSPDRDRAFQSISRLRDRIRVAVAGRAAEKLIFGEDYVTTGAASDIEQATAVAHAMVTKYGMSELGFIKVDPNNPSLFDTRHPPFPIIQKIIATAQEEVAEMLDQNKDMLDGVTNALLDQETLTGDEIRKIAGKA